MSTAGQRSGDGVEAITPQLTKPSGVGGSEGLVLPSPAPDLGELLLNAKLRVPRPRGGLVSRVDLIKRARSSGCRIVGITAPAGYGKSTLLAEWADCEDRRVAGVSFDRFDDDPMALLVLLASAYARIDPGGADLRVEVRGVGASVLGRAAPRLAAAFNACPVPFVLLLDDVHELRSPDCHDVLGLVIARIPDGSQLVAASRWEQPHLPRLRVSGDALALDASDLALDVAGAQQIFSQAQVSLTPEAAAEVTERTEGWPAGLYLAAQLAAEGGSSTLSVSGDDRYVADYLYRESLANQPDDVQRFLRRTAVLDHLCGPLCDAVLATSDSAEQLRRLEASSLFVVPLHRQREWYRYHALFQEFLLAELRRREPDMVDGLHLGAADWYESNGSPAMAVEHLLRTAERHRAARLATELCSAAPQRRPTVDAATLARHVGRRGDRGLASSGDARLPGVRAHRRHRRVGVLGGDGRRCLVRPATAGWLRLVRVRQGDAASDDVRERPPVDAGRCDTGTGRGAAMESAAVHRPVFARRSPPPARRRR